MHKKKILLIEDDEFCAYTVLRLMRSDFDIVHKFSGLDGVEEAKSNSYDLLLLDIGLKDINGIEVLKKIKEIPEYKTIPSIAVTAFAMLGDKERFLNSGFTFYIAKPYLIKEFKELIIKALEN
jgi:two-component system cell cycle response regulator DivK